ncbi:MAG TPA: chromate transporter, partial [Stellaceae bacterium]|nr:chromate transporter [Stellaceae bacterium]
MGDKFEEIERAQLGKVGYESSRRSGLPTLRNHRPAAAQGMMSPASKKAIETGASARRPLLEVLLVFLRLGLTSFGGPVAHLGYFRGEFVERRKWLDEAAYVDIVALCQFLPGPASSQVGITLGTLRAGLPGALAAWFGFTMPSAVAMIAFGYGVGELGDISHVPWLQGLKIVAVAVVAQAVWGMARSLCPDRERATLAVGAAVLALAAPSAAGQIGAIIAGGLIGWQLFPGTSGNKAAPLAVHIARPFAGGALVLFFALLLGLPALAAASSSHILELISSFYRSGALVFGGGHVVLPLLQLARIVCMRSDTIWILSDGGSEASSCGSAFLMASAVAMTSAPDWRWTAMMIAGSVFIQPARFTSCGPTMARPTSRTRTGPLTPTTPGLGLTVVELVSKSLDPCAVVAKVPLRLARI